MWAGYDGWIRSNVANPMDRRFWNEVSGSYVQGFREYIEPLLEGDG
jgi:hypothetical protein